MIFFGLNHLFFVRNRSYFLRSFWKVLFDLKNEDENLDEFHELGVGEDAGVEVDFDGHEHGEEELVAFVEAAQRRAPHLAVQRRQTGLDALHRVGRAHGAHDRAVEEVQELLQTRLVHHVHLHIRRSVIRSIRCRRCSYSWPTDAYHQPWHHLSVFWI